MGKAALGGLLVVALLLASLAPHPASGSLDVILRSGDWIRYRCVYRFANESCTWILRVTIEWYNSTHVRYNAGLESFSGGGFCKLLTVLLVLGMSTQQQTRLVKLASATPSSMEILISPAYTGTFKQGNYTLTYYRGVLVRLEASTVAPVVASYEVSIVDTSIEELKSALAQQGLGIHAVVASAVGAAFIAGAMAWLILRRRVRVSRGVPTGGTTPSSSSVVTGL